MATFDHLVERGPSNHRVWGAGCDAWSLLSLPDITVVAEVMPPGTSEIAHRHARANQLFYVLAGELMVEFNDDVVLAGPGQAVAVAAGVIHRACNEGTGPAEFLAIAGPGTVGDREDIVR